MQLSLSLAVILDELNIAWQFHSGSKSTLL